MSESLGPTTRPDSSGQSSGFYDDDDQSVAVSPIALINILLRRRWLIAACFFVAVVTAYVYCKLASPVYEATARFLADPKAANRVLSTGEAYGIEARNPLDYFSVVAKSPAVVDRVLARKFESHGGAAAIDFLGMSRIPGESAEARTVRARPMLDNVVTLALSSTKDPSFLSLKATWTDPKTAAELANAFTDALSEYDRTIKSAVARTKREFIEQQLADTQKQLKVAEETVRDFRIRNRMLVWQPLSTTSAGTNTGAGARVASPDLQMQADRLEREARIHDELFATLKHELELAKIAEANDSSSIVIVEQAYPPMRPSNSNTRITVFLGAIIGLMLGIGGAFLAEYASKLDKETADMREFATHVRAVRGGLARLASLFAPDRRTAPAPAPPAHDKNS
jgi:uncharacterized protein involved in exopolysaccharide biosynthesis